MMLVMANKDIQQIALTGVYSDDRPSIVGNVNIPALDYVAGDILSLNFNIDDSGRVFPIEDENWTELVKCTPDYALIKSSSHDVEDEYDSSKNDLTKIALLKQFLEVAVQKPQYMNYERFEEFLAMAQCQEPVPKKRIVHKGHWVSSYNSTPNENRIFDKISDSLVTNDFFETLDKYRDCCDFHYKFDNVSGFASLAMISVYATLRTGRKFVKCAHCGRYFSPSRANEIYCERIAPGQKKKTCKEEAKFQKQLKRERASESGKKYKSIYTMMAAKLKRYQENEYTSKAAAMHEMIREFSSKAEQFRKMIKRGERTEEEYMEFLDGYYKNKKSRPGESDTETA